MTSLTKEACDAARREAARRRAVEELLRARSRVVDVHPTRSTPTLDWIERPVREERAGARRRTRRRSRPATTSARPPSCSATATRCEPAKLRAGHLHEHHRQHRARLGSSSPPASSRSCRCSSARTRSRRRPTSSTSSRSTRTSASARCRPRTRSPRAGSALGAAFAGHLGVTTTSGPGVALKSETISLGGQPRAAAAHHRHPARRPVDRACRPRPRRPTCCMAMYGRHGEAPLPDRRRDTARRTASTPRSRRSASRSSTARR